MIKYLLLLLLVLPVWVEKRTVNNKATPKTYGPANRIGALYVEDGKSINVVDLMRKGSWVNIRTASGLNSNLYWGDNGSIEIMGDSSLNLNVKVNVFAGSFSLSSIDSLLFKSGDGTEDISMEFEGRIDKVNAALNNIQYIPPSQDPTLKTIAGCLAIDVDIADHENQTPVINLSDVIFTK
jgi:hypothetical protein